MENENFEEFIKDLEDSIQKGKDKTDKTEVKSIMGPDLEQEVQNYKPEEFNQPQTNQQEEFPPEQTIKIPDNKSIPSKKITGLKKPSPQMFPESKDTK